jgi:hypothetical protein
MGAGPTPKMTNTSELQSARPSSSPQTPPLMQLPMTTPLDPGTCPCGQPASGDDGFCDAHARAVAFKLPLGPNGDVLPAVWWHWPHRQPCPHGEAWRVVLPRGGNDGQMTWACPHRSHEPALEPQAS